MTSSLSLKAIEDAMHRRRRERIDTGRKTNPNFAPDIESWKELLTDEQRAEVQEMEDLHYKTVALQGPEKQYRQYKLTKKQLARLCELETKYRQAMTQAIYSSACTSSMDFRSCNSAE
jgi:hypothetical protein